MDQVWVGVAEIGLGLVFCFLGYSAARVVLGVWGAALGFALGSFVHLALLQWTGSPILAAIPIQVFAIVMALVVAWLSFAFYTIGVLVSMGSVGWGLGILLAEVFHFPGWLSFALAMITAAGLVMVGWTLNLPRLLLVVLTALVGAAAIVDGVQFLLGQRIAWLDDAGWRLDFATNLAWTAGFVVLAVAGITLQLRQSPDRTLREAYRPS